MNVQTGTCIMVKVGRTDQAVNEVAENIVAAVAAAAEKLPKQWEGIQGVHIKTSDSIALPIYSGLPPTSLIDDEKANKIQSDRASKLAAKKQAVTKPAAPTKQIEPAPETADKSKPAKASAAKRTIAQAEEDEDEDEDEAKAAKAAAASAPIKKAKTDAKAYAKPEAKADAKPEAKSSKAAAKTDAKADAKAAAKTDAKTAAKTAAKAAAKTDAKAAAKPTATASAKSATSKPAAAKKAVGKK